MDEWHVGDPPDWGDSVGVPDIPYMGYINGEDEEPESPGTSKSHTLSDKAWDLRCEGRYSEALDLINRAIENHPYNSNDLNRKAIILEDLRRYNEALDYYDQSIETNKSKVVLKNKANCMLEMLKSKINYTRADLDFINLAIKTLPSEYDSRQYLLMKGEILECLGEHLNAIICYMLSSKCYDEVDEAERQLKEMRNSHDTFIIITGTRFYKTPHHLTGGVTVDLIPEPYNRHDPDAIRVEVKGETVGYVANSPQTLIDEVKSASDIKNTHAKKAMVQFILLQTYIIAKLIN